MATQSRIEWTESTWNPITGCTKISPGCKNCYTERMARRLHAMRQENYHNWAKLTPQKHRITEIRDQCIEAGVPFFFKQWGGIRKKQNGKTLDGRTWSEFPSRLAIA